MGSPPSGRKVATGQDNQTVRRSVSQSVGQSVSQSVSQSDKGIPLVVVVVSFKGEEWSGEKREKEREGKGVEWVRCRCVRVQDDASQQPTHDDVSQGPGLLQANKPLQVSAGLAERQ
ncbi:hypothetical protein IAQ61_004392 [Plenodomus lingam]|uniref:uncharacterized protein n=1 Tax=Leptosphaeria maculans TaxID=5022 RepID=UPI003326A44C|nr:hypothetical protein IAQ61_004392 [Plenodomus lingam]